MKLGEYIKFLRKLRAHLNKEEIVFIIDFLLQVCKHA